jgi:hypothetical protein
MTQASDESAKRLPVSDDEIEAMQAKVAYWENYVAQEQRKREEAAAVVQTAMDQTGLSARGINPSDPVFAEIALDLEFQKQVSLHYGLKLDKAQAVDTSKPDASRWRQRTHALKV